MRTICNSCFSALLSPVALLLMLFGRCEICLAQRKCDSALPAAVASLTAAPTHSDESEATDACTNMETDTNAVDDAMCDSPAAVAAAALVALPASTPAAAGEQRANMGSAHHRAPSNHSLSGVPRSVALLCAVESVATPGAKARRDSDGQPICESCPVRLSRAKGKLHLHGPGHVCHKCYTKHQRAALPRPPADTPSTKKRRAQSDPDESSQPPQPALTRRVRLPRPAAAAIIQNRTREEERVMRLLEETVARREAALAEEVRQQQAHQVTLCTSPP